MLHSGKKPNNGRLSGEFTSFADLGKHLGILPEEQHAAAPIREDFLTRYHSLRSSMRQPNEFPALSTHSFDFSLGGSPVDIPAEVIHSARFAGQNYIARRWGPGGGPRGMSFNDVANEVQNILDKLHVPASRIIFNEGWITLTGLPEDGFPKLPEDYGFKGGVARKALGLLLQRNIFTFPVRDIDLLRFGEEPNVCDQPLAEEFMLDDLTMGGAGVEVLPTPKAYFNSREMTVNEMFLQNGAVSISFLGFLHAIGAVVQDTATETGRHKGEVKSAVATKLLRFASQMEAEGREVDLKRFNIRSDRTRLAFHVALQLARALESSEQVAELYIEHCRRAGLLKPIGMKDVKCVAEAKGFLLRRVPEAQGLFDEMM